jgi:hypothetical protein
MTWQPIATAPPDEDLLLVGPFHGSTHYFVGRSKVEHGGHIEWEGGGGTQPTHWMPLPPPPTGMPTPTSALR